MPELADLPVLRPADCGHGFIRPEVPPSALSVGGRPLYFCKACRAGMASQQIETKDARTEQQRRGGR